MTTTITSIIISCLIFQRSSIIPPTQLSLKVGKTSLSQVLHPLFLFLLLSGWQVNLVSILSEVETISFEFFFLHAVDMEEFRTRMGAVGRRHYSGLRPKMLLCTSSWSLYYQQHKSVVILLLQHLFGSFFSWFVSSAPVCIPGRSGLTGRLRDLATTPSSFLIQHRRYSISFSCLIRKKAYNELLNLTFFKAKMWHLSVSRQRLGITGWACGRDPGIRYVSKLRDCNPGTLESD